MRLFFFSLNWIDIVEWLLKMSPKKPADNKKEMTNVTEDSSTLVSASLTSPPAWFQTELERVFFCEDSNHDRRVFVRNKGLSRQST